MNRQLQISKLRKLLVGLNFLQIGLLLVLLINRFFILLGIWGDNALSQQDFLLGIALIVILWSSYVGFRDLQQFLTWEKELQMQKEAYQNMETFNTALRSQRHDFLNHIQVIYSLIELKEYEEVSSYLHKLYGDIEKLNTFMKTKDVAINALLQAKSNDAVRWSVQYQMNISTTLQGLPIPSWEMCRCLGNLIDNGIFAAASCQGKKDILVAISENITYFEFAVTNTGPCIAKEDLQKIFEPGFTTKGKQGEGMGLHIVKTIIESYEGTIDVDSSDERTTFTLHVPKVLTVDRSMTTETV